MIKLVSVLLQFVESGLNSLWSFVNRQVNHEKELRLADVMSDNISKDPAELGVPQRLCMEDQVRVWGVFFYCDKSYTVAYKTRYRGCGCS